MQFSIHRHRQIVAIDVIIIIIIIIIVALFAFGRRLATRFAFHSARCSISSNIINAINNLMKNALTHPQLTQR